MSQLESVSAPDYNLQETGHVDFVQSHNLFINENSTTAYVVGSFNDANGGLLMFDISDPANPVEAGRYGDDGYTHDVQCVIYEGPDERYTGEEVCFACNEGTYFTL